MNNERYSRQADIIPAERLRDYAVTVIGVGAIGRQVAIQLTAIGVTQLQLVDFDTVEISNLATQGYFQDDLGRLKIDATAAFCRRMNPEIQIDAVPDRFRRTVNCSQAVFCCVDKIETRARIWPMVQDKVLFFCDGRMSAEVLRVITACDPVSRTYYPQTFFAASEAQAGPCTAKSTIFCANIAAGFMLSQYTHYLRGIPVDRDLQLNLLACEMTVN